MDVRVKLKVVELLKQVALVNTGFETDELQLLVPYTFLVRSGIDLEDLDKLVVIEYDTAGGSITIPVYPKACRVAVIEPDRVSKEVKIDLAISFTGKEILMSDALIGDLGIDMVNTKTGSWKFIDDSLNTIKKSYKP
jgi:hypothetical protein